MDRALYKIVYQSNIEKHVTAFFLGDIIASFPRPHFVNIYNCWHVISRTSSNLA